MLKILYFPRLIFWRTASSSTEQYIPEKPVALVPIADPLNNRIRLAQYRRKSAIKRIDSDATFPLEVMK